MTFCVIKNVDSKFRRILKAEKMIYSIEHIITLCSFLYRLSLVLHVTWKPLSSRAAGGIVTEHIPLPVSLVSTARDGDNNFYNFLRAQETANSSALPHPLLLFSSSFSSYCRFFCCCRCINSASAVAVVALPTSNRSYKSTRT